MEEAALLVGATVTAASTGVKGFEIGEAGRGEAGEQGATTAAVIETRGAGEAAIESGVEVGVGVEVEVEVAVAKASEEG